MEIGDISFLRVRSSTYRGAYLEYRDFEILVPPDEQKEQMEEGNTYLVIIYGKTADQYFASQKIGFQLEERVGDVYSKGQKLEGIVYAFTPLGVKVALDKKYSGLLYQNEIFQKLELGDTVRVYIKNVRDDGKVELSLQQQGYKNVIDKNTDKILTELQNSKGFLAFNDKSDPEEIKNKFQMSKKNFKEAIGRLYKDKKILISDEGISLV